jgi:nucleotide-binding universal stress UspA family protein
VNWVVNTIVVPSDGSSAADAQLASARAIARATGARIVVAHIDELVRGHMGSHSLHACEDALQETVRDQVEDLRNAGVRAEVEIRASAGELAQAIADIATMREADLIVTRKGRPSGVLRLFSRGVAQQLVGLAGCPVLVVS